MKHDHFFVLFVRDKYVEGGATVAVVLSMGDLIKNQLAELMNLTTKAARKCLEELDKSGPLDPEHKVSKFIMSHLRAMFPWNVILVVANLNDEGLRAVRADPRATGLDIMYAASRRLKQAQVRLQPTL